MKGQDGQKTTAGGVEGKYTSEQLTPPCILELIISLPWTDVLLFIVVNAHYMYIISILHLFRNVWTLLEL